MAQSKYIEIVDLPTNSIVIFSCVSLPEGIFFLGGWQKVANELMKFHLSDDWMILCILLHSTASLYVAVFFVQFHATLHYIPIILYPQYISIIPHYIPIIAR